MPAPSCDPCAPSCFQDYYPALRFAEFLYSLLSPATSGFCSII
jgi:hypothetical protein